jgi:hypothetical protein
MTADSGKVPRHRSRSQAPIALSLARTTAPATMLRRSFRPKVFPAPRSMPPGAPC